MGLRGRNPFLPWLGFDLAGLPFVKGRAVPLYWSAMDVAERLHLGANPWQSAGTASRSTIPLRFRMGEPHRKQRFRSYRS